MKKISTALFLSTLAGLSLGVAHTAQAQTAARFSTVEFKDTTLNDALEMVFQAANNPAHTIDPSASLVPIGGITLQNIQWDAALRTLANQNNFKVSRGADGSYLVEPREPILQDGMGMEGGMMPSGRGGMMGGMGAPGGAPFNPFGGGGNTGGMGGRMGGGGGRMRGNTATPQDRVNFQMNPTVSTQANAQTNPRLGGAGGSNNSSTADQQVIPLYVRHIYVGGIAQLFQNSSTIGTQPFVSPASSNMGGMGGMGGMMGGMGGMGGMMGGMGGMMGGMGGMGGGMMGGMGGMMGGMGGMGMGGMGMGGMSGGFGGGGFGFGF